MKTLYTPLLIILLSTFHASSQSHFITAGQTQGMMVTDYVPDLVYYKNEYISTYTSLDINSDGVMDIDLVHSYYNDGMTHGYTRYMRPLNFNTQLQGTIDTATGQGSAMHMYCGHAPYNKLLVSNLGDTIMNNANLWFDSFSFISTFYRIGPTALCERRPYFNEHYYFSSGRFITNQDTLLFYIHLSSPYGYDPGCILDYAIEGPDSTIIISSVNNLSSSNISISPNPFTSFINITTDKPFQYNISDYLGRVVLSGITDKTIATEALASGNYVLIIKNEEMVTVRKMVKY